MEILSLRSERWWRMLARKMVVLNSKRDGGA